MKKNLSFAERIGAQEFAFVADPTQKLTLNELMSCSAVSWATYVHKEPELQLIIARVKLITLVKSRDINELSSSHYVKFINQVNSFVRCNQVDLLLNYIIKENLITFTNQTAISSILKDMADAQKKRDAA